jgi:hypothetical protein
MFGAFLIAGIWLTGFAAGFGLRAYLSFRRRKRFRLERPNTET